MAQTPTGKKKKRVSGGALGDGYMIETARPLDLSASMDSGDISSMK